MHSATTPPVPPPGQVIPVDGHAMHVLTIGEGSPTVVLEAGGASWSLDWYLVQQQVSEFTRVCSYDRAGFGWSAPGPKPRHARALADELSVLLRAAQLRGPYVLVGASFGGHVVRLLAAKQPNETVGVVLVDARHEDITARMPRSWAMLEAAGAATQKAMLLLSRLRLLRHMAKFGGDRVLPPALKSLPAEWRSRYLAIGYQPKYFEANLAELQAITQSDAQVKAAGNLGDIPLAVIRHGIPSLFESMGPADAANAEAVWQELQAQLAALSSQSQLTVADRSGHMIQLEQPSAVVEAVHAMVDQLRAAG